MLGEGIDRRNFFVASIGDDDVFGGIGWMYSGIGYLFEGGVCCLGRVLEFVVGFLGA